MTNLIVIKNEEKRQITGPVMIPYYDDCDACRGEKQFSPEEIGLFMNTYMERHRIIEPGHTYLQTGKDVGEPNNCWQLEEDTEFSFEDGSTKKLPEGTWMMTSTITDDDTWEDVKKGAYKGFSVTVVDKPLADQIAMAAKSRTLIKDIPDPEAIGVALVDKPCVYDATFCSVKGINKEDSFEGIRDRLNKELRAQFPEEECYIQYTYDDKIIVHAWVKDSGDAYFEIPYSIDVNDKVTFGDPIEVKIEYVAKKMLENKNSNKESLDIRIKNFFNKVSEKISNKNEVDDMSKEDKYVTKEDLDAKFEEHENKIVAAVKEATTSDDEKKKKRIKELKDELKELEGDNSSSETDDEEVEETEESEEEEDNTSQSTNDNEDKKKKKKPVKGSQKSLDNHDVNDEKIVNKSASSTVYEAMGRTNTGSAKNK